jgi:hypothetical protein
MKIRWMFNKTFRAGVLLGIFAMVSLVPVTAGAASWFATLQAETDVLDLETQTVAENDVLSPDDSDTADMHLAYNADRSNPFVVFQNQVTGILIAFADGAAFGSVDFATAEGLTFTDGVIDTPLDSDDTVVLKTQEGKLFKIGNPVDNGDGTVTLEIDSLN